MGSSAALASVWLLKSGYIVPFSLLYQNVFICQTGNILFLYIIQTTSFFLTQIHKRYHHFGISWEAFLDNSDMYKY